MFPRIFPPSSRARLTRGLPRRAIRTSIISLRGIPACASCHGAHAGGPIETPTLSGQRQEYLAAQLSAFAIAPFPAARLRQACSQRRLAAVPGPARRCNPAPAKRLILQPLAGAQERTRTSTAFTTGT